MSSAKLDEMKSDVEELNRLLNLTSRQRVKDLLTLEIRKIETKIIKDQEQSGPVEAAKPLTTIPQKNRCYEVKLNNYAWDQSDKFVKIFVTLKNVQALPAENVFTIFTDNSMELHVNGLDNRNYTLPIKNLLEKIDSSTSSWKVKTDMVVVSLTKVTTGHTWSHLTSSEKKVKAPEPKEPKLSDNDDPSAKLMDLMKQMYEDGDDDMKRTIAKSWTESCKNPGRPSF